MGSRAKKLLKLAITRSSESDHDHFSDAGIVVEFVPKRKLKAVRKDNPALNLVEDQKYHRTEPGIEAGQILQSITMYEENDFNLLNIAPQNNDATNNKITEKGPIEQEITTAAVLQDHAEPMLGGELGQEPDQCAMAEKKNNNMNNIGPHDSDLTDCEDLSKYATMKCLNVRNKTRGRAAANVELHLRNKYYQRPQISSLKKKDLLSLCDSNVIPRVYREYYSTLEAADIDPDEYNEND